MSGGPESGNNRVGNNSGKTGWEGVAAVDFGQKKLGDVIAEQYQNFKGETNIGEDGKQRTFTLQDNYPRPNNKTEAEWNERLAGIQAKIDEKEAEGAARDAENAFQESEFGQVERDADKTLNEAVAKAKSMDDKYLDFLDKRLNKWNATGEKDGISAEEAEGLLNKYLKRRDKSLADAQARRDQVVSGARQDYADRQTVGTPEEQERYRQLFMDKHEDNPKNMERTGRLPEQQKQTAEVKPEDVAQTVEKVEKATEKVAEKADKKGEELGYSMKEILEKGKDIVPSYMLEYWEKACEKYSLEEMQGITAALENLKNNKHDAAMKEVRGKWIEDGFVMGAIAMFDPAGIKLIREALTEEYGAPNEHNKDYLERYARYHERRQREVAKASEQKPEQQVRKQPELSGGTTEEVNNEKHETKKGKDGILEGAEPFAREGWEGEFSALASEMISHNQEERLRMIGQFKLAKGIIESLNAGQKLSDEQIKSLLYKKDNTRALQYVLKYSLSAVDAIEDYRKREGASEDELKIFGRWRDDYARRKATFEKKQNGNQAGSKSEPKEKGKDIKQSPEQATKKDELGINAGSEKPVKIDLSDVVWEHNGGTFSEQINKTAKELVYKLRAERARRERMVGDGGKYLDAISNTEEEILDKISLVPEEDTPEAWNSLESSVLLGLQNLEGRVDADVKVSRSINHDTMGSVKKEMETNRDSESKDTEQNKPKVVGVEGVNKPEADKSVIDDLEPSDEYYLSTDDESKQEMVAGLNKYLAYEEIQANKIDNEKQKKLAFENLRLATDALNAALRGEKVPVETAKLLATRLDYRLASGLLNRFSKSIPEAYAAVVKYYQDHGYKQAA